METGLTGKRVLVTAASKGMGRAVAEAFLAEGARVAISSSSEDQIRHTAIDGLMLSNALRPALVGMAKTLAREAAPDVRVNNIATEHILTDRIRHIASTVWNREGETGEQTLDRMAAEVPMRRYGTPAELASAVVFLASDAASYITGVTLAVDGGMARGLY